MRDNLPARRPAPPLPRIAEIAIQGFELADRDPAAWKALATLTDRLARDRGIRGPYGYDPTAPHSRASVATVSEQLLRLRQMNDPAYAYLAALVFAIWKGSDYLAV